MATRTISLTPHPDSETEDLATVLSASFIQKACREHGTTAEEFYADQPHRVCRSPTLKDLRDWLGY